MAAVPAKRRPYAAAAPPLLPLLLLLMPCLCDLCDGAADVGDALKKIFNVQSIRNHTDVEIPEYMYRLYQDTESRQYDMVRSISPKTEPFGTFTSFVYDLSAVESTEIVQKAVLHFEHNPNHKVGKKIDVSLFYVSKNGGPQKYLDSASMYRTLDLFTILGSGFLKDVNQLIVHAKVPKTSKIGLVLYSTTTATFPNGHELSAFLFETSTKRYRRSVLDNEIDVKQNTFKDESKRKKKKKKVSRVSKLQAVDAGDTIAFTSVDQCRMERLVLNFADIGWEDWVIYPKGFETNYCAGGCLFPLGKGSKPTNHATVQSLARSFGRLWDVPEPSCVPDTLAPLTLLYMDHANHVLLKSYPDMRVVTCSCK